MDNQEAKREANSPAGEAGVSGRLPFARALVRYASEHLSNSGNHRVDRSKVNIIKRAAIGKLKLASVDRDAIQSYCIERLKVVSPSTVRNELCVIRRCIEVARRQWGLELPENPAMGIVLPPQGPPRYRTFGKREMDGLLDALAEKPLIRAIVIVAILTQLRRGEILALTWADVDLEGGMLTLRVDKDEEPQIVRLVPEVVQVLGGLEVTQDRIFPVSVEKLRWHWEAATRAAGIRDLTFNDLRHILTRTKASRPTKQL